MAHCKKYLPIMVGRYSCNNGKSSTSLDNLNVAMDAFREAYIHGWWRLDRMALARSCDLECAPQVNPVCSKSSLMQKMANALDDGNP